MTVSGALAGTLPHSCLKLFIKNLKIICVSAVGEGEGSSPEDSGEFSGDIPLPLPLSSSFPFSFSEGVV